MNLFKTFFSSIFGKEYLPVTRQEPVCPNCNETLVRCEFEKGILYECPDCKGLWLNPEIFGDIVKKADEFLDLHPQSLSSIEHTFKRSESSMLCPYCALPMDNYVFDYSSEIWIDACPKGHGIWLDPGELHLIKNYRKKLEGGLTSEEKLKLSMAFLDGASKTIGNLTRSAKEIRLEHKARHGEISYYSYGVWKENLERSK